MQSAMQRPHQLDQLQHPHQFELHDQLKLGQRMSDKWKLLNPSHQLSLEVNLPFLIDAVVCEFV